MSTLWHMASKGYSRKEIWLEVDDQLCFHGLAVLNYGYPQSRHRTSEVPFRPQHANIIPPNSMTKRARPPIFPNRPATYATMVLAVALSYLHVGGSTPTVL